MERLTPLSEITHIVLTQLDPKNIPSLEALLKARMAQNPSTKLEVVLSNPAARLLQSAMGESCELCVSHQSTCRPSKHPPAVP